MPIADPAPQRPPATVPVIDPTTGRLSAAWATYFDAVDRLLERLRLASP